MRNPSKNTIKKLMRLSSDRGSLGDENALTWKYIGYATWCMSKGKIDNRKPKKTSG